MQMIEMVPLWSSRLPLCVFVPIWCFGVIASLCHYAPPLKAMGAKCSDANAIINSEYIKRLRAVFCFEAKVIAGHEDVARYEDVPARDYSAMRQNAAGPDNRVSRLARMCLTSRRVRLPEGYQSLLHTPFRLFVAKNSAYFLIWVSAQCCGGLRLIGPK